jgi:hypothetical protein
LWLEYGGLAVPDVGRPDFVDLHTMIVWSLCDVLIARKPGVWKRKARNYLSRQRSELELIERSGNPCLKELFCAVSSLFARTVIYQVHTTFLNTILPNEQEMGDPGNNYTAYQLSHPNEVLGLCNELSILSLATCYGGRRDIPLAIITATSRRICQHRLQDLVERKHGRTEGE